MCTVDYAQPVLHAAFGNETFDLGVKRDDTSPLRDIHPQFLREGFHTSIVP